MSPLRVRVIALAIIGGTGPVMADGYVRHDYVSPGIFYGSSFSGNYGNKYLAGYYTGGYHNGYGYRKGVRYGYSGHGSNNGWYFLGGAILGSLLTYGYTRNRYSHYQANTWYSYPSTTYYQPAQVVEQRVVYRPPATTYRNTTYSQPRAEVARRLHRDLEGRCYEIKFNESGDELRSELPASECDWD